MMRYSIVMVSFNTADVLCESLAAIYQHVDLNTTEVIVVDNASSDASVVRVRAEYPWVKLIVSEKNLGFGLANNLGVAQAQADYVMLLNSDAILNMDTGTALRNYMLQHAHVSCVGPRIVLPLTAERQPKAFGYQPALKNVLMQSLGLNKIFARCDFFNGIDGEYRDQAQMQVGWLSGVCMMMRKADYLAVGGFDARFFMYCEDIDLCMKLSRLGRIVFVDDYPVMHYGGASTKSLGSKIRNSVWQQQNLLTIIRDYYGQFVAVIARAILGIGMCIRLAIAVLMIPKRGITHHEALSIAWARLLDLLGWHSSRGVT